MRAVEFTGTKSKICSVVLLLAGCGGAGCFLEKDEESKLNVDAAISRIAFVLPANGEPVIDFGTQTLNTTTDQTLTVINKGVTSARSLSPNADSPIEAPFSFKGGTFPGTDGTCGTVALETDQTCTIILSFNPTEEDLFTKTLKLEYDNGVLFFPLELAMLGSTPSKVTISDSPSYSFGRVAIGQSVDKTFTVTNSGGNLALKLAELTAQALAAPFSIKGATFPGTGGTCEATLAGAGKTCTFVLTFAPTGVGDWTDDFYLSYADAQGDQSATLTLTGAGI